MKPNAYVAAALPVLLLSLILAGCPQPDSEAPFASFTADVTLGRPGLDVHFTDASVAAGSSITAWRWDFGDPSSGALNASTEANPSHMYLERGIYSVVLNVTAANGLRASSGPMTIQVRASGAEFTPGTVAPFTTGTIGPGGGEVVGPVGTPVGRVTVLFPQGALEQDTLVALCYDDGLLAVPYGEPGDGAIVLDMGAADLREPLTIVLPNPNADERFLILLHIDEDGRFSPCPIVDLSESDGTVAFQSRAPGCFVCVNLPVAPHVKGLAIEDSDCGFRPQYNGFQESNTGSVFFPGGECGGFVVFAKYFFETDWGQLYPQFMIAPGHSDPAEGGSRTGQQIAATRAHNAHGGVLKSPYSGAPSSLGDLLTYLNIVGSIQATGNPVYLHLHNAGGDSHALLAYKTARNTIWVYDPNYPWPTTAPGPITLAGLYFESYDPGDRGYTTIEVAMPLGVPSYREPFETIIFDARQKFNDRTYVSIDVDSHSPGDTVPGPFPVPEITLHGSVVSGQVAVARLKVHARNDTAGDLAPVETRVGLSLFRPFELADVPLAAGQNTLIFETYGEVREEAPPAPICYQERETHNQYTSGLEQDFVLNVPFHLKVEPGSIILTEDSPRQVVQVMTREGAAHSAFPLRWTAASSDRRIVAEPLTSGPQPGNNISNVTISATDTSNTFDGDVTFRNQDNAQDQVSLRVDVEGAEDGHEDEGDEDEDDESCPFIDAMYCFEVISGEIVETLYQNGEVWDSHELARPGDCCFAIRWVGMPPCSFSFSAGLPFTMTADGGTLQGTCDYPEDEYTVSGTYTTSRDSLGITYYESMELRFSGQSYITEHHYWVLEGVIRVVRSRQCRSSP